MTLDGFLTVLTLLAGVYAIMSPITRLKASLEAPSQLVLALLAFGAIVYFEFFSALGQPCPPDLGRLCRWITFPATGEFEPRDAAFVVTIGWMLGAWLIHVLAPPGPRSLSVAARITERLITEQRFGEAIEFATPYLPVATKAAGRKLLAQRLHDRVASVRIEQPGKFKSLFEQMGYQLAEPTLLDWTHFRIRRAISRLSLLVPSYRRREDAGRQLQRLLLRSTSFRRFLVTTRPYAAIPLLKLEGHTSEDFVDRFFRDLVGDVGGILYEEIHNNQNVEVNGRYWLPEDNRILHHLFHNAKIGERIGVWRPVGEAGLARLRDQADYVTYLNGSAEAFDDERWNDPTWIVIFFFDIMVKSAAHQGIEWHMWLFYMYHYVERLEEIYAPDVGDKNDLFEFPSRGAQLIYQAFSSAGDWVALAKRLPATSPYVGLIPKAGMENGNIPASACIVLGRCLAIVLRSDRIGDRFKRYMYEVVIRDVDALDRQGQSAPMRQHLIQAVLDGDLRGSPEYARLLAEYIDTLDHVLQARVPDYCEAVSSKAGA